MSTPLAILTGWLVLIFVVLLFGRAYAKWRGIR
jgi:ABC-type uncharacterized transport system permease subunit